MTPARPNLGAVLQPSAASPQGPSSSWVDASAALKELGGDVQTYRELCALFREEVRGWLDELPSQAAQDRAAFIATIHELANACAIIGAAGLARQLRERELAVRDDPAMPLTPCLAWVQGRLDEVVRELAA